MVLLIVLLVIGGGLGLLAVVLSYLEPPTSARESAELDLQLHQIRRDLQVWDLKGQMHRDALRLWRELDDELRRGDE